MLARIFPSFYKPIESRFKKKIETKKIIGFLQELKNKEIEFKKTSDNLGPGSLDFSKYSILAHLNKKFDEAIKKFNASPIPNDEVQDTLELINLLREFNDYLGVINTNHADIINKHRRTLPNLNTAIRVTVLGGVGVSLITTGCIAGLGIFLVSESAELLLHKGTNLFNDHPSATAKIMLDFITHLNDTIKNLILVINLKQLKTDNAMISNEDNMTCPITADLMEDPYLCRLDGYSYEKYAIVKCLTDSRKSPMTRKEMARDDKIEDVIIENRALKNIITNYKLYRQQSSGSAVAEVKLNP
ncbi:MAG TPA: U-box domain-containing protein [Gammaproteobacteria bacterium]|jgi:hypothetical protein|nr:U-box domain-containing protein [Gammaproteobacteria bacterium]